MGPFRQTLLNHLAFASANFPRPLAFDSAILSSCGIGRVAFIRHGNTNKAPSGGADFDRQLTDLGREQARAASFSYGEDLRPFYHSVLCSPAPRCVETAKIFLDATGMYENQQQPTELNYNQVLYDGAIQPEGSRMFKKIGYAPLRKYYNDTDEEDRIVANEILGSYAMSSLKAIERVASTGAAMRNRPSTPGGTALLFFAHAVYLPAASFGLASAIGCTGDDLDIILDTNTKEAEGYLVNVDDRECSLLSLASDTS